MHSDVGQDNPAEQLLPSPGSVDTLDATGQNTSSLHSSPHVGRSVILQPSDPPNLQFVFDEHGSGHPGGNKVSRKNSNASFIEEFHNTNLTAEDPSSSVQHHEASTAGPSQLPQNSVSVPNTGLDILSVPQIRERFFHDSDGDGDKDAVDIVVVYMCGSSASDTDISPFVWQERFKSVDTSKKTTTREERLTDGKVESGKLPETDPLESSIC